MCICGFSRSRAQAATVYVSAPASLEDVDVEYIYSLGGCLRITRSDNFQRLVHRTGLDLRISSAMSSEQELGTAGKVAWKQQILIVEQLQLRRTRVYLKYVAVTGASLFDLAEMEPLPDQQAGQEYPLPRQAANDLVPSQDAFPGLHP